ncbi:MAG: RAMP superfamily CRISPR-associated protein [Bacteroidales bacterium]|jgi:CRISPR/Cas system CMR subunit Cmr4 (Cas7 group RAMP superfamily)|nr:RAMP superfamily CRISPR-associated protein [Bacteroidales bacterium]
MSTYQYRQIARIVIEAVTPLAVGAGEKSLLTDSVVARDVNGLPYIPGTAIAGIIRHELRELNHDDKFFGFSDKKKNSGKGSEIIFSSAQIVDSDGKAIEGLISDRSDYLKLFDELPIRQHVKMNEKGTADVKKHAKFDEEVVYKGARFMFEIELLSETKEDRNFQAVLDELSKDTIRFGGGTRKGFGEIKIVSLNCDLFDLSDSDELEKYINKTSSLNDEIWQSSNSQILKSSNSGDWTTYHLTLTADDFFLFGSGMGDDEADMTPVTESYIDWSSGKPEIKANTILIPGSSVKGAVAHRVAYHYNKSESVFADKLNADELLSKGYQIPEKFKGDIKEMVIDYNPAVRALFGCTSQDEKEQKRGNVLISDVIQGSYTNTNKKILNHVSIDRFTGGAIEGALFSENVVYGKDVSYILTFKVRKTAIENEDVKMAFENTLNDICSGLLPLGGGTNRGHGCFKGKLFINEKEESK